MTISTTMLTSDMTTMIADAGSTLVWGAQSVTVTASARASGADQESIGALGSYDLQVAAKLADFTTGTPPSYGDAVTVDGVSYHVDRIERDPSGLNIAVSIFLVR